MSKGCLAPRLVKDLLGGIGHEDTHDTHVLSVAEVDRRDVVQRSLHTRALALCDGGSFIRSGDRLFRRNLISFGTLQGVIRLMDLFGGALGIAS